MGITIKKGSTIQGFKFGEENVKLNFFADDVTSFLNVKVSYISLLRLLEDYGECSGFKVNHEKMEVLACGDSSLWEDCNVRTTYTNSSGMKLDLGSDQDQQ